MKVSIETVATREIDLTVEPDEQTVGRAMRQAARQLSRRRPVAGYRPGKAPYAMVERLYGREVIFSEALNDLGKLVYHEALKEAEIEPLFPGEMDIESQEPLILKFRVPLEPVVKLGDYASLAVEPEPEVAISEEQIDEQVELVQRRYAEYTPAERPIEMGDQVIASIQGESEGETVVDQSSVTLDINDKLMPPGFGEALIGMAQDETREFSLAYPDDYEDENLAGKNVDFSVTIATIHEVELPAVDDDLAKTAGDYETLDDLRQGLAESLKSRLEAEARSREASAAVELLVEQAEVEYPEAALEAELDRAIRRRAGQLAQMGFAWERYLQMVGQTEDELREQMRPEVEGELVRRLVIAEFARAEKLEVGMNQVNAELQAMSQNLYASYGERATEMLSKMDKQSTFVSLHNDVLTREAVRRLTNMATGRPLEEDEAPEASAAEAANAEAEQEPGPEAEAQAQESEE